MTSWREFSRHSNGRGSKLAWAKVPRSALEKVWAAVPFRSVQDHQTSQMVSIRKPGWRRVVRESLVASTSGVGGGHLRAGDIGAALLLIHDAEDTFGRNIKNSKLRYDTNFIAIGNETQRERLAGIPESILQKSRIGLHPEILTLSVFGPRFRDLQTRYDF